MGCLPVRLSPRVCDSNTDKSVSAMLAAPHFLTKFDWPRRGDFGSAWHSVNGGIMQLNPLSGLDVIIINGPLAGLMDGILSEDQVFPLNMERRTLMTIHWSLMIWGQCVTWLSTTGQICRYARVSQNCMPLSQTFLVPPSMLCSIRISEM